MLRKLSLLLGLIASTGAMAQAHWGYSGENGPEHWAQVTPEFGACAGKNQSPVNLQGFIDAKLAPIPFNYKSEGREIVNTGHSVQINYTPGSTITVDGIAFELKQLHFHAPSENMIEGKSYPLEAHLVHASAKGELTVVALMFKEGASNPALEEAWKQLPAESGDKAVLNTPFRAERLLPKKHEYFRFNGSLTTPPCTEGVRWIVMRQPLTASKQQIEAFKALMEHPNNRPVQPINAREILE